MYVRMCSQNLIFVHGIQWISFTSLTMKGFESRKWKLIDCLCCRFIHLFDVFIVLIVVSIISLLCLIIYLSTDSGVFFRITIPSPETLNTEYE